MFSSFCYKKKVIKPVILLLWQHFFATNFNIVIIPYTVIKALAINRNMKIWYCHMPTHNSKWYFYCNAINMELCKCEKMNKHFRISVSQSESNILFVSQSEYFSLLSFTGVVLVHSVSGLSSILGWRSTQVIPADQGWSLWCKYSCPPMEPLSLTVSVCGSSVQLLKPLHLIGLWMHHQVFQLRHSLGV